VGIPTADVQIEFLQNLQLVLDEGSFVATYKYALLLALADLCVECGDDSGQPLALSLDAIAEKFIQYYWPHARALSRTTPPSPLYQNSGKQAAIVSRLCRIQRDQGHSLRSGPSFRARRDLQIMADIVHENMMEQFQRGRDDGDPSKAK